MYLLDRTTAVWNESNLFFFFKIMYLLLDICTDGTQECSEESPQLLLGLESMDP